MDQFIYASLSHTHYWYEVSMLKVPAIIYVCIDVCVYVVGTLLELIVNRGKCPSNCTALINT